MANDQKPSEKATGAGKSRDIRAIVFDASAGANGDTEASIKQVPALRIVSQTNAVGDIEGLLGRVSADVVLVNLDPSPDTVLSTVALLARQRPQVAFFALSKRNDPDLILTAMRSGFCEFVRFPDEMDRLIEAIDKLRDRAPSGCSTGKLITVLGSVGGVGCTTLAVNLAVELAAASGEQVAVVDLDFKFGHIAMMLDLDIQHSLAELCGPGKVIDEHVVERAVLKHKTGVHVLARPREFEETEDLSADACVELLALLRKMYAYVVTDGPTRSDETARSVLDQADRNLMVVQPLVTAARNAKRVLSALARYGFDTQTIDVICNRAGGGMTHLTAEQLEKSLQHKILLSIPDDWVSVSSSINLGEPLISSAPKSKARLALQELVGELAGVEDQTGEKAASGFLGGLFRRGK